MHISLFFHFFVVFHNNLFILQGIYLWHNELIFHGRTFFLMATHKNALKFSWSIFYKRWGERRGLENPKIWQTTRQSHFNLSCATFQHFGK